MASTSTEEKASTEVEDHSKDIADSTATPDNSTTTADVAPSKANGDTNDEQRPSDSSQPSSKKRRSNIQLIKDGCNSDGDGDQHDEDEEDRLSEPFTRASRDVLQKRKIVKADNKWSSVGGGTSEPSGGTFGSVKLAPTPSETSEKQAKTPPSDKTASVFGSGTGFGSAAATPGGLGKGFGNVSLGFGAIKSSSPVEQKTGTKCDATPSSAKPSAFGGGFAGPGFGALKPSTTSFVFGATDTANDTTSSSNNGITTGSVGGLAGTFATIPTKASNAGKPTFPTSSVADTANGEQDEDCLCQVRAKLSKMVPEKESLPVEDGSASQGDVLSVPSSAGRMELAKPKKENQGDSLDKVDEVPEKATEPAAPGKDARAPNLVTQEAGIGPVRVLRRKPPLLLAEGRAEAANGATSARVVQRQETSGGQAMKLILNLRLVPDTCTVVRRSDTYVQLNALDSEGKLEYSLFKVKTKAEADTLEEALNTVLEKSE